MAYLRSSHRGVLKLHKFHRKTPVLESPFNKVAGLKACNFIKKRLQYRRFPVKFTKCLGTLILKNICKWLLMIPNKVNTLKKIRGSLQQSIL